MDEDLKDIIGITCIIVGISCFVGLFVVIPAYYSSCREARIFNGKYETEYTCGDFFWAGNQINEQIQTIKIEK